jgi:hypothetical protein
MNSNYRSHKYEGLTSPVAIYQRVLLPRKVAESRYGRLED